MRKSTRIVKRLLALFLVVLMSINTFAAVVGDNDGAAFITKAEFDSMKNDFQSQLDRYNSSIDNKIDGAIASYLAGLQVTKKLDLPILVARYNYMRWQSDWKIYGKRKKWTGYSTYDELTTNQFHTPSFNEPRINTRGDIMGVDDITTHQFGSLAIGLKGNIGKWVSGTLEAASGNNGIDEQADAPPVACIKQILQNGQWVLPYDNGLFTYYWSCPMWIHGKATQLDAYTGTDIYSVHNWDIVGDAATSNPWFVQLNDSNSILKYRVYWIRPAYPTHKGTYTHTIKSENVDFPYAYSTQNMLHTPDHDRGYNATTKLGLASADDMEHIDELVANGVSWEWIDSTSYPNQRANFYYMMLGRDNDQRVNLYRNIGKNVSYEILNTTGSSGFATVTADLNTLAFNQLWRYSTENVSSTPYSGSLNINIPLLPTSPIRELTNGVFVCNNSNLKMGQGLPIVLDSFYDGYIQLSFDYNVQREFPTSATNKKIVFSLKKNDYLSNGNYVSGYTSLDDPFKSENIDHEFKNYPYENTSGHCDVTVPIKKDESLWFRMSPQDESGGYYATMRNLKVTLLSTT